MLTGKVIRFDDVRGYGFIAPDGGGEDIFVHANVLGDDKYVFGPGLRVEFEVTDGDRGPKAYAVHLLPDRAPAAAAALVASAAPAPRLAPPAPAAAPVAPPPVAASAVESAVTAPPAAAPTAAAPTVAAVSADSGDEELCDVLTVSVFRQEITELLLKSAPGVTAAQILDMRAVLITFGRQHGWIEG